MDWTRRAAVGALAATILPLEAFAAETATPADGVLVLEAAAGLLRLLPVPAPETAVWAFNGQVPGPLIRIRQGNAVKVRLVNKLPQPTSLAWHGVRIANAMDGVAGLTQKSVQPGESFDYDFVPPDAGLYWYHPHVFPHSAEQIGRGLYGLLLVEEADAPPVDQDLLVMIDDWSLDTKGQISGSPDAGVGSLVTVNSMPIPGDPLVMRPGTRLRLRFANVCAARIAIVTMTGMDALVVAIDGQASEVFPPAADTLPIGPGARFEVVVDLPAEDGKTTSLVLRSETGPDRPLMNITTKGAPIAPRLRVGRLPMNPLLPTRIALEKSIKVNLALGGRAAAPEPALNRKDKSKTASKSAKKQSTDTPALVKADPWLWTIGGVGSDGFSGKPLFRTKRGGAVTLAFVNKTTSAQQMHVHGHVFRVLHDLDDGWDPYWRDSILIAPGKTKHIAFVADNPGKWAVESLILDRQVTGMAAWFEVA